MDIRKEMMPPDNSYGTDYCFNGRILDYTGDCLKHIAGIPVNIPYAVCQCATGLTFCYTISSSRPTRILPYFSFSDGLVNGIKLLSHKKVPINTLKLNTKSGCNELFNHLANLNESKNIIIGPFLSSKFEVEFLNNYEIYPSQYLICTSFKNNEGVFFHPDGTLHILSYDDLLELLDFTNSNIDNHVVFLNTQTEAIYCSTSNVSLNALIFGGLILADKKESQLIEMLSNFLNIPDKVSELIPFNYDLSRIIVDMLCVKETGEYAIFSDSIDSKTKANLKNALNYANELIDRLSIIRATRTIINNGTVEETLELWGSYINSLINIYEYSARDLSL